MKKNFIKKDLYDNLWGLHSTFIIILLQKFKNNRPQKFCVHQWCLVRVNIWHRTAVTWPHRHVSSCIDTFLWVIQYVHQSKGHMSIVHYTKIILKMCDQILLKKVYSMWSRWPHQCTGQVGLEKKRSISRQRRQLWTPRIILIYRTFCLVQDEEEEEPRSRVTTSTINLGGKTAGLHLETYLQTHKAKYNGLLPPPPLPLLSIEFWRWGKNSPLATVKIK